MTLYCRPDYYEGFPTGFFFSPFENGMSGWRWYRNFLLDYSDIMVSHVESDTLDCLARRGLVMC